MFEQKKEDIIKNLNYSYGGEGFSELSNISDDDFIKIIDLYEKKSLAEGKDPWHYLYGYQLIIMQQSIYEIVKDNTKYNDITEKLESIYEKELNRRLQRRVISYGEETLDTYRTSYAEMPSYSLTYAIMCINKMKKAVNNFSISNDYSILKHSLNSYEQIKRDFANSGMEMPKNCEDIARESKIFLENVISEREEQLSIANQKKISELIKIQEEVNRMEKEVVEIEKKLSELVINIFSTYFKKFAEKNPNESQRYIEIKKSLTKFRDKYYNINKIKDDFKNVREMLIFYNQILPEYDRFYQLYSQMHKELEDDYQKDIQKKLEKRKLIDLIYKDEIAKGGIKPWVLYSRDVPIEYQGMSYEQVEKLVNQKKLSQQTGNTETIKNEKISDNKLAEIEVEEKNDKYVSNISKKNSLSYSELRIALKNYINKNYPQFGEMSDIGLMSGFTNAKYEIIFKDGSVRYITLSPQEQAELYNYLEMDSRNIDNHFSDKVQSFDVISDRKTALINNIILEKVKQIQKNFGDINEIKKIISDNELRKELESNSEEQLEQLLQSYSTVLETPQTKYR